MVPPMGGPPRAPANGNTQGKPARPAPDALTRATMAMGANSLPDAEGVGVTAGRAPARTGPPPPSQAAGNGQYQPPQIPPAQPMLPDFSNLPPGVAASLARLAGVKLPEATAADVQKDKDGKVPPAA